MNDWKPVNETAWLGSPSDPAELADEIEARETKTVRLPYVESIEVVTITMSVANRDLIVNALRSAAPPRS